MIRPIIPIIAACMIAVAPPRAVAQPPAKLDYRILATSKTSTMEKEMQEAAQTGYRFSGVMGGETSFGGSEVVVIGKPVECQGEESSRRGTRRGFRRAGSPCAAGGPSSRPASRSG